MSSQEENESKTILNDFPETLAKFEALKTEIDIKYPIFKAIVDEQVQNFNSIQEKVAKTSKDANQKIKLNIRGKIFTTTRETLTSEKDTFFCGLLSDFFDQKPHSQAEFFIDRDNNHFHLILNHLRGSNINSRMDQMPPTKKAQFMAEVEYYRIHSLIPKNNLEDDPKCISGNWEIDPNYIGSSFDMGPDKLTVKKKIEFGDVKSLIGNTGFSSGIHIWEVSYSFLTRASVLIGVIEKSKFSGSHDFSDSISLDCQGGAYGMTGTCDVGLHPCKVVRLVLDCDKGLFTIKSVEGLVDLTCTNLHNKTLFPYFCIGTPSVSLKIKIIQ